MIFTLASWVSVGLSNLVEVRTLAVMKMYLAYYTLRSATWFLPIPRDGHKIYEMASDLPWCKLVIVLAGVGVSVGLITS